MQESGEGVGVRILDDFWHHKKRCVDRENLGKTSRKKVCPFSQKWKIPEIGLPVGRLLPYSPSKEMMGLPAHELLLQPLKKDSAQSLSK
jgi:hypothetical protein